ncbi:MAG: hypothetical protein M3N12_01695, partial [Verrucomicrobiota bacterium]|nr:hypothetical protein [Verrucomicrobiota bacterium]
MIAWTLYVTFAGALLLLGLPRSCARWIALATAVAGFGISVAAFFTVIDIATFASIVRLPWVP